MIKIKTFFRHNDVDPQQLLKKNVVIIDVLRATTVIATALANGAKSIQTIADFQEAFKQKENNKELLLAGERNALKIKDFDFGNSPLEMIPEKVKEKNLLMSTSNGTQAVGAAQNAKSIITAAFVNMAAVVDYLLKLQQDFTIICSGTNGQFSLDDALAAGLLINRIKKQSSVELCDSSIICTMAIPDETTIQESLKDCYHVNILKDRGFQDDLDYCLSIDILNVVPQLINGKFIL